MKTRILVALYGQGLAVSTVSACLANHPEFQIIRIEGTPSVNLKEPDALRPDVVLFDLASAQACFGIFLMHRYPGIRMVGIDLVHQTMLVLSGESTPLSTIEDLVEGIEKGLLHAASHQKRTIPLSAKGEHHGIE